MAVLCFEVSTKEIVMNENEFNVGGKDFVAVPCDGGCDGCYFDCGVVCHAGSDVPNCNRESRVDGKFVIFVEKQQ